jgi:Zn-dependent peptidase ImmA (M78 family)
LAAVRRKHIRALVEGLLAEHHVRSGPVPVQAIAHALGIEVRHEPAAPDLAGFLVRDMRRKRTMIGVNKDHHANRQRFTIGHELGHFLLHEGEQIHVDRESAFRVKLRNDRSSDGVDVEEKEANLFAAELLMPARFLERDLTSKKAFSVLDENAISALAKKYEVSAQALTFRLAYLDYVQL